MTVRTYTEKISNPGWQARTTVYLRIKNEGKELVLDITSSRPQEGGIASLAAVYHMDSRGGLEHCVGQDYRKLVMYDPKVRCTQRNLHEQHSGVLKILDLLAAEALEVYSPVTGTQD